MKKINYENSNEMYKIIDDLERFEEVLITEADGFDREDRKELKELLKEGIITPSSKVILDWVANGIIKAEYMYLYFTADIICNEMIYVKTN